ncbi:UvrD-helicase domain-containing protein [Vagococcus fluvialis]|uniref:UvrD-helicase domain-containing protein n=1 Tax=Vagococcus fluvialis TaxID=2738 RepID=UPI00378B69D5
MKIVIAGAGAGKTTLMSEKIIMRYEELNSIKNIYCITFTNSAVSSIEKKLLEHFGTIPTNIKLSTIHSFLFSEFIKPYYFVLYEKKFDEISTIKLDKSNAAFRNKKIKELEEKNVLHVEEFSKKAKWIISNKSTDKKKEKEIRKEILKRFSNYCDSIFIDEAQDIDQHIFEIITVFNELCIDLELVGDPKQDVKGFGTLRKLCANYPEDITYIQDCYRCPQLHLNLSNSVIPKKENQFSEKSGGKITIHYENDINVKHFMEVNSFKLSYISESNERFSTKNSGSIEKRFNTLFFEIQTILETYYPNRPELLVKKVAYNLTKRTIKDSESVTLQKAVNTLSKSIKPSARLEKVEYAKLISALKFKEDDYQEKNILTSIDKIKGQEGESCLFLLTTDLMPYLLGEKMTSNKTKSRLYVALTRSLDILTIVVSKEVEKKYGRNKIDAFFQQYL